MRKFLLRWLVMSLSLIATALICNAIGLDFRLKDLTIGTFANVVIGVAALGFLNATLGNLLKFLTAPLNCLTLGLVSLVINAAMLQVVGSLEFGFKIGGFLAAFAGSLILAGINAVIGAIVLPDEDKKK